MEEEETQRSTIITINDPDEEKKDGLKEEQDKTDSGEKFETVHQVLQESTKDKPVSYVNSSFTFPQKLFHLLDNEKFSHLASWRPHGISFQIFDEERFMEEVAPLYFKQKKWPSFQRQLNIYGFKKNHRGVDSGCYFHPYFQRGNNDMIFQIKRMPEKGTLPSYEEVTTGPGISSLKKKAPSSEKSLSSSSSSNDVHSSESGGSRKFPMSPSSFASMHPFPYYMPQFPTYPSSPSSAMHTNQPVPMMYPPFSSLTFPAAASANASQHSQAYMLPYPGLNSNFPYYQYPYPYPITQPPGNPLISQSVANPVPSAMFPYSTNQASIQQSQLGYSSYFPFTGAGHNYNPAHSVSIPFPAHHVRSLSVHVDPTSRQGQPVAASHSLNQSSKEDSSHGDNDEGE